MTKVSSFTDVTGYTTYDAANWPRKIKLKEILMWGRGRRKDRKGGGSRDLVTLKEAERSAGAEGGATRAAEGWGGEGRPRDGDRRRALLASTVKNKLAGLGAVESVGTSEPGTSLCLWHTCHLWGLPVGVPSSQGASGVRLDG